MKTADVNKKIAAALDQLIADLERGRSQAMLDYLGTMSRFHRYSWCNTLLIVSQCPHASRVAGFRAWNRFNRFVRRGEKGIVILAPMVFTRKPGSEPPPELARAEAGTSHGPTVVRFKAVYVFDVSQTDGEPLPEAPAVAGDPADYLDRLRHEVRSSGITLEYEPSLSGADGVSEGGLIRLRVGLTAAQEFAVLVHELAHERLHRGEARKTIARRTRELEAEAVAFVVSSHIGLQPGTASSDYIQLYGGDKDALTASLVRVQGAASQIIGPYARVAPTRTKRPQKPPTWWACEPDGRGPLRPLETTICLAQPSSLKARVGRPRFGGTAPFFARRG